MIKRQIDKQTKKTNTQTNRQMLPSQTDSRKKFTQIQTNRQKENKKIAN